MKYLALALLVATAIAQQEVAIDNANFPVMNTNMNRIGYSVMGNTMYNNPMFIPKPPQKAIDHYNSLADDDFPVDYSMRCSNSCGCRQTCVVMWWVPCNCMCPPQCPVTTEAPTVMPWQPPRNPPQQWIPRPGPEPIPPQQPQFPWQQPPPQNPQYPSFPNINLPSRTTSAPLLTHPPQPWPNPPSWNNPQNPSWPQPEPQWPWQQQPSLPVPLPEPLPPNSWNNNWNNNNNNNQFPNHWPQQPGQPEPVPEPQWPWQQQPNQPVPLPEPLPPTWNNNWSTNNNNNQFPNQWPQQPAPPREDCSVCNSQCSCTPCSVIWVCPTPCPASCCNGACPRNFVDAEDTADYQKEEVVDQKESSKVAFHFIPEYLQDIFIPGMI